jgi:hypothetical protein
MDGMILSGEHNFFGKMADDGFSLIEFVRSEENGKSQLRNLLRFSGDEYYDF